MDAFHELRRKAQNRRDRIIAQAQKDYSAALAQISALERTLEGKSPTAGKKLAACVMQVVPTDKPFTSLDIMSALEILDPTRSWLTHSVNACLKRLRERKVIRCARKAKGQTARALYVVAGLELPPTAIPFDGLTLWQAMAELLRQKPMNELELLTALLAAGYPTRMARHNLRAAIDTQLHKRDDLFRKNGDKWACG